jgi:hypothetical protein
MTLNVSEIVTGDSVFDVMSVFMHIRIRRLSTFNIDNHLAWLYVLRRAPGGSIAFIDFNGRADSNVSEVSSPTELCFVCFFFFWLRPPRQAVYSDYSVQRPGPLVIFLVLQPWFAASGAGLH